MSEILKMVFGLSRPAAALSSLVAIASCSFDTSTAGFQLEDAAAAIDAGGSVDASQIDADPILEDAETPDADLTPDADTKADAGPPFVDPPPIANLVYALPHAGIVVDGAVDEWQKYSWVSITSPSDYRIVAGTAGDANDLSASLAARWDASTLYIAVVVRDDTYENNGSGEFIWHGDSMQVAFDVADNNGTPYDTTDDFEYGWARASGDALASYRWIAPTGHPAYAAAPYNIIRTGTTTTYEVSLSASDLGLASFSAATGDIGFAWIVTEADGAGREGFLEWTSGLGFTKNPALFGTLRFHPSGPAPL